VRSRILVAVSLLLCSGCAAELDALFKKPPPPVATAPAPAPPPPVPAPPSSAARPGAAPAPGPLRQELSAEEEQRLADGARQNIGDVERLLAELEGRPLKPPQQEAFKTAKNFLAEARAALGQRDYQRAANLASKARALTDDISGKPK